MIKDFTSSQRPAKSLEDWLSHSVDVRRDLCLAIQPLKANGITYAPDVDSCVESGFRTWITPGTPDSNHSG